MVDRKALIVNAITFVIIGIATAQQRYKNPVILRERRRCALVAVQPLIKINDRRVPNAQINIRDRGRLFLRPRAGIRITRPIIRQIQRPLLRTKRQTLQRSPPSRPTPPKRISLPDRGSGFPPDRINVPATGQGSQLLTHQTNKQLNSIAISHTHVPTITNNQRNVIKTGPFTHTHMVRGSSESRAGNTMMTPHLHLPQTQMKIPAIPDSPENRIDDKPLIGVPLISALRSRSFVQRLPRRGVNIRLRCNVAGRVCGWELDKKCRLPPCPTQPACLNQRGPANKPGNCPGFISEYLTHRFSIRYCFDDRNCRGKQICCHGNGLNGGSACVNPIFPFEEKTS